MEWKTENTKQKIKQKIKQKKKRGVKDLPGSPGRRSPAASPAIKPTKQPAASAQHSHRGPNNLSSGYR
jgi:hypothetical protein